MRGEEVTEADVEVAEQLHAHDPGSDAIVWRQTGLAGVHRELDPQRLAMVFR